MKLDITVQQVQALQHKINVQQVLFHLQLDSMLLLNVLHAQQDHIVRLVLQLLQEHVLLVIGVQKVRPQAWKMLVLQEHTQLQQD